MNPRLVFIGGPLKGAVFALTEEEVSIGRESSNRLVISDLSVSRRHCVIRKEADQVKVSDLASRHGTFVNGLPMKERVLEHGDQIRMGDSLFLFLLHEGEVELRPSQVQLNEERFVTRSIVRLSREEAAARLARDLNTLLKISAMVVSIRGLEALGQKLLESLFEVVPAEGGVILLVGESPDEFSVALGWDRNAGPSRPVQVSRTVVQEVLRDGVAILSNDVLESDDLGAAESLIVSKVRSLLAVPLVVFERILGVIYLDTSNPTIRFDENHLQLVTAIAGIAAVALENARYLERLESEKERLQTEINIAHSMVGESPRMREVYQFIAKLAPGDSTVLICGESGTGKELVARAIHENSLRAGRPFVTINCAALVETLLESELFGHEKGAFTGAIAQQKGKLEAADGGTVFLDEIGELAPTLQAKLLRVLQEREFERVGGTRPLKVDIRLIAATNRNLEDMIKAGAFRQDLYYRLNVVSLRMPPLRDRREDIPLLSSFFAAKYSRKCKRRVMGISAEARAYLINYDWPGNVRELENAIERAVVLGAGEQIEPEDLPEAVLEREPFTSLPITKYHEVIKAAKKQLILDAVAEAHGTITEAAKRLGVNPKYLHRLIRNLNLRVELKK
jgi:Nif-specific regulatory protein